MRPADAIGTTRHGAGFQLVVGDGGAFDGAADQKPVQPIGQGTAIEAVRPFAQIARQVLGADAMVGADEPGFRAIFQLYFTSSRSVILRMSGNGG